MTIKFEGSGMRLSAIVMLGLGGLVILIGLLMSGSHADSDVVNIGLLNTKSNLVVAGGLMSVCGSIFYTADQIIRTMAVGVSSASNRGKALWGEVGGTGERA